MKIDLGDIKKEDLSYIEEFYPQQYGWYNINSENGTEHYKLLSYISGLFENQLILDLGTKLGLSAFVLAKNNKNKVITYDISGRPSEMDAFQHLVPNLEFRMMNVLDEDPNVFKEAKLMFLDIDPHDGNQEAKFISLLESINWTGVLLVDDIEWFEGMKRWFDGIKQTKYNITKWGHVSGTGLIDFGGNIELTGYQ